MFKLKNIGCLVLIILIGLGLVFAKFLVPVVPVVIVCITYFSTRKLRATTFGKPQNIYELQEGFVLLEGTVVKLEEEIKSYYFNETCVGYEYKEIENIPIDDGYNQEIKSEKTTCINFTLSTNSGTIKINGAQLNLKQLSSRTYNEHSLKPEINDISHVERILKHNDKIVLVGTAIKNNHHRFEIAKHKNEPFFVTTRNTIETQKISYQVLLRLFPWACVLYLTVNYFLFFAPSKIIPKNDLFAYVAIFGLPIIFVIFWLISKDKKDWFSQILQYLAGVCIFTSLLSFPLIVLFYMIELEPYRMHSIFICIFSITALALLINYKKLIEYNNQQEKFSAKKEGIYNSNTDF